MFCLDCCLRQFEISYFLQMAVSRFKLKSMLGCRVLSLGKGISLKII